MYLTEVSHDIDVFLSDWRPCLCVHHHQQQQSSQQQHQHNFLFVQPRTGNPLTSDSVYQIVARQCYTYTGQRTNPHLLRDMIVTHVRESQQGVTEPQLEALALFMGHSVAVQRASYDRRTLTKKVAPAVNLIQQVNTQAQHNNNNNPNNNNNKRK
jgi:integrase